jgi:hypothetical protein
MAHSEHLGAAHALSFQLEQRLVGGLEKHKFSSVVSPP